MEEIRTYESYPSRMVAASLLVTFTIYASGALVLSGFGPVMTLSYLLFILWSEVRVMRMSCVDCWYYGKRCAFGRGKVAALLFRKGDPARFAAKPITWVQLLPDMLVPLLPLVGGIVLLIRDFVLWRAALMVVLLAGAPYGNYFVRSSIACRFCKQRELGCPAEKFFGGK
jgi:hypothetical protein